MVIDNRRNGGIGEMTDMSNAKTATERTRPQLPEVSMTESEFDWYTVSSRRVDGIPGKWPNAKAINAARGLVEAGTHIMAHRHGEYYIDLLLRKRNTPVKPSTIWCEPAEEPAEEPA